MFNKNVFKYDDMKRDEHMAVRETVGWYYWTHELLEVKGPDAAQFLEGMFPNPIANLTPSRARYTTMLDHEGTIMDDVVVFRLEEDLFWISTLYAMQMLYWFGAHKGEADVSFNIITKQWDMFAIQGPRAMEMVDALVKNPVDDQKFFQILDNEIDGVAVKVNRGGFTGEKVGFEIYVPSSIQPEFEERLRKLAPEFGGKEVEEFQIMALTLPTERGFYLMCDLKGANPLEVGLDKNIDWDKEFVGKQALLAVREQGPSRVILGYIPDEDDIHINSRERGGAGDVVIVDGEKVGYCTKTAFSYLLNRTIGYVLVERDKVKVGDRATINDNWVTITEKTFA